MLKNGGAIPFDLFFNPTGLAPNPVVRRCGLCAARDAHLRFVADPAIHCIDGRFFSRYQQAAGG
ncbi:hypothetical protein JMJ55_27580 [Belnapia sp. T6]|uniref:Uncharacterized protein n=1 Tax=Belnapia mucosa TaxID=2804532 RepID=A0ABS1VBS5_9PROT|nr:hypothetical protein [Belnapia mucosa]MBL6459093.1 hypothetical protein [Belnapia mucosa]